MFFVLQYGMWIVPVMIAESQYPEFLRPLLKFNPMYYIVEGYRDALIRQVGFWENPMMTLYFWVVILLLFLIGRFIFKRMKPHFADVM